VRVNGEGRCSLGRKILVDSEWCERKLQRALYRGNLFPTMRIQCDGIWRARRRLFPTEIELESESEYRDRHGCGNHGQENLFPHFSHGWFKGRLSGIGLNPTLPAVECPLQDIIASEIENAPSVLGEAAGAVYSLPKRSRGSEACELASGAAAEECPENSWYLTTE